MSVYGLTWTVMGVARGSVIRHAHACFPQVLRGGVSTGPSPVLGPSPARHRA